MLSGYGVNLRTALNASNRKIYDNRTYRFDSPYERGDCGGEGSCGTCIVSILSGQELLNEKYRVEEKALLAQNAPPNYRWACRVAIGEKEDSDENVSEVVVKLRPQTQLRGTISSNRKPSSLSLYFLHTNLLQTASQNLNSMFSLQSSWSSSSCLP